MNISIEVSNDEYEMILNSLEHLQAKYFNNGYQIMADKTSNLYKELRELQKLQIAKNTQILVVDIQNPGSTMYRNANTIGSFLLDREISGYLLFIVGENNKTRQIVLTSSECSEIQSQVLDQIYNFF
jgi:hypothetical protein